MLYESMLKSTYSKRRGKREKMRELINNALNGINIIPTVLLCLVLLYWINVIIGLIDLDLLDFDIDVDLDAGNDLSGFYALLAFLNVKELPFMLVFSVIVLNFWVLSMLIYLLPIVQGGFLNVLLMIGAIFISLLITKIVTTPLKGLFKKVHKEEESQMEEAVLGHMAVLLCDIKDDRLGQAEIKRDGASILINVKAEDEKDSFNKGEEVFIIKKDGEKDLYYVMKIKE